MNSKDQSTRSDDGDCRWQALVARARQAPAAQPLAIPAGLADRVLDRLPDRAVMVRARGAERLVAVAASLALAASLLIAVLSWSDLEAVLAAGPASLDQIVQLEPAP